MNNEELIKVIENLKKENENLKNILNQTRELLTPLDNQKTTKKY
jgi:hypothetical protein